MADQFDISGKRVLITGGAGGIGAGLVAGFLAAGTKVLVSVRDSSQIETVKATHNNEALSILVADLNDPNSISELVANAGKTLGGIDVLICAHGNVEPGPAVEMSDASWAHQLQLNLTSVFQLARAVAPAMLERRSGKIINIASMLSFQGGLKASGYAAAKGGVAQLTKALANEWSPHGVNVNAIALGYMKT